MLSKTLLCLIVLRYYSYLFVLCYRSQVRVKTMAEMVAARTSSVIIIGDTHVVVDYFLRVLHEVRWIYVYYTCLQSFPREDTHH